MRVSKGDGGRGRFVGREAAVATAWLAILVGATAVAGQEPAVRSATDTTEVYEREVFTYPRANRRDPFRPLTAGTRIGPRFEDLELSGVLFAPEVGSVATLRDVKTGKRYRTREGDSLGGIRVVSIREDEVDFTITSFGVSRQETLRVSRDKEQDG